MGCTLQRERGTADPRPWGSTWYFARRVNNVAYCGAANSTRSPEHPRLSQALFLVQCIPRVLESGEREVRTGVAISQCACNREAGRSTTKSPSQRLCKLSDTRGRAGRASRPGPGRSLVAVPTRGLLSTRGVIPSV